jgi:hypothetical protein
MEFWGHTYTKILFITCLEFRFNWGSCILCHNAIHMPTVTSACSCHQHQYLVPLSRRGRKLSHKVQVLPAAQLGQQRLRSYYCTYWSGDTQQVVLTLTG